jgi:hypothetical protein
MEIAHVTDFEILGPARAAASCEQRVATQPKHGVERPRGSSAVLRRLQDKDVMTKDQKVIRAKVGLLELAKQLGNVSQACKMTPSMTNSRQTVGSRPRSIRLSSRACATAAFSAPLDHTEGMLAALAVNANGGQRFYSTRLCQSFSGSSKRQFGHQCDAFLQT